MRSFKIEEVREFMMHLLRQDTFDTFLMTEAVITTFATFSIDGAYHKEFFDTTENETEDEAGADLPYATWQMIRPHMDSLIRGKHSPLGFRIVLRLQGYNVEKLIAQAGIDLRPEDVAGLYLNIRYDNSGVTCITGTSLKTFTLDKTLEHTWDDMVGKLFQSKKIPFVAI